MRKHDVEFNVSCAKTGLTFLFFFFWYLNMSSSIFWNCYLNAAYCASLQ